jgi:afadin
LRVSFSFFQGGTMKVFGDALNPSIPYKTFLLSIKDTAEWVVKEMLEKYGLKHEDPQNYCLLQVKKKEVLFENLVNFVFIKDCYSTTRSNG